MWNHKKKGLIAILDDLILAGNNLTEIHAVKFYLDSALRIKDLENLHYFLDLEVACADLGISLCQRKYVLDLLHDTGLTVAKPVVTPMV